MEWFLSLLQSGGSKYRLGDGDGNDSERPTDAGDPAARRAVQWPGETLPRLCQRTSFPALFLCSMPKGCFPSACVSVQACAWHISVIHRSG